MRKRKSRSLRWQWGWYAVFACGSILLLPRLFAWGMFLDGVTYATISRNLSVGLGTWWRPYYTATLYPEFYEQPPLGFIIQSLFFKLGGDHYLVEKAYCLIVVILTAWLFVACWRQLCLLVDRLPLSQLAWLPVLIWMSVPKWAWAYRNNILENTMTVFCLLAFLVFMKGILARRPTAEIAWSAIAGIALACAALTKGLPGLFPLVSPIILAMSLHSVSLRRAARITAVASIMFGVCAVLVMLTPQTSGSLAAYVEQHLVPALSGTRAIRGSRLAFFGTLLKNIVPMGLIVCIAEFRWRSSAANRSLRRNVRMAAVACTIVALSGSLPLLLSHTLRSFYLVPSFPFFSMAAALLIAESWKPRFETLRAAGGHIQRTVQLAAVAALLVFFGWSTTQIGTARKDCDLFVQLKSLEQIVPEGTIIGASDSFAHNWIAHALLYRYLRVSIDTRRDSTTRAFYLAAKPGRFPKGFVPTGAGFAGAILLRRSGVPPSAEEDQGS